MASILTIAAIAASETNEDQARPLIDGKDWLGPEFAGLDPPVLKKELLDKGVGTLIVGRCWCGLPGCNDVKVEVTRRENSVLWSGFGAPRLRFDAGQYDAEVARFAQDRSWESLERAAQREIEDIFRGTTIKGGLGFEWASTRNRDGFVRLYFRKAGQRQKVLKFRWDGVSVAGAIERAKAFRAERFSHCD